MKTAQQINLPQTGEAYSTVNAELPSGASFHRGNSKQDFETPWEFIWAIECRFGPIIWDLAATIENHKAPRCITEAEDSLKQPWHRLQGLLFLNPPFHDIAPWAKKCWEEGQRGAQILLLVPASVGSNWFVEYVYTKANVIFLRPRICFDGLNPYPKDLILCHYLPIGGAYECWKWR